MTEPIDILLVEDNETDAFLIFEGFADAAIEVKLNHVHNGVEALAYLRNLPPYAKAKRPDLVLLDINMPVMDGKETLREIVADPKLRGMPVVVLTTSTHERDIKEMYDLRCSTYISKPVDYEEFQRALAQIHAYWDSLARLL